MVMGSMIGSLQTYSYSVSRVIRVGAAYLSRCGVNEMMPWRLERDWDWICFSLEESGIAVGKRD